MIPGLVVSRNRGERSSTTPQPCQVNWFSQVEFFSADTDGYEIHPEAKCADPAVEHIYPPPTWVIGPWSENNMSSLSVVYDTYLCASSRALFFYLGVVVHMEFGVLLTRSFQCSSSSARAGFHLTPSPPAAFVETSCTVSLPILAGARMCEN